MATGGGRNNVLKQCLGSACDVAALVDYADDSVVSKTLLDKIVGTITVFAFDKGQGLSEHTSPYDAVVQVLDGEALITIAGNELKVAAGQIVIMPASEPHSLKAVQKFKMMLTMIRA